MQQISKLLETIENKSLLIIFPHPDDESFATGALLLKAKSLEFKTNVLTLTHGENGHSVISKGEEQSKVREEELVKASRRLEVDSMINLNLKDSHLKDDIKLLKFEIEKYITEVKPGLVVTYDHGGFTGHPDHIVTSVVTLEMCKKHKVPLLWYTPSGMTKKLNTNLAEKFDSKPEYIVRSFFNFKKARAFFEHKSQISINTFWYNWAIFIFLLFASETYHLVNFKNEYKFKYYPFKFD